MSRGLTQAWAAEHPSKPMAATRASNWRRDRDRIKRSKAAKLSGRSGPPLIIAVLKEHGAGAKTADLARKHGISEATIYNWKAKFGGMDVSEAKRLKALED